LPPVGPEALCHHRVVKQLAYGGRDLGRPLGIHQEAGLAFTHSIRNSPTSPPDYREPAGSCLHQRYAESLCISFSLTRKSQVDLGAVVKAGKIGIRHARQETDPIGDPEVLRQSLQDRKLSPRSHNHVGKIGVAVAQSGENLEPHVDSFVFGQPRNRDQPATPIQPIPLAYPR
jgi:hypothetical protein